MTCVYFFNVFSRAGKAAQSLPKIPTQSVSVETARQLLTLIDGPEVPTGWSGGVSANYTLGGSWADGADIIHITVSVNNILKRQEVKNIHATMPASDESR